MPKHESRWHFWNLQGKRDVSSKNRDGQLQFCTKKLIIYVFHMKIVFILSIKHFVIMLCTFDLQSFSFV